MSRAWVLGIVLASGPASASPQDSGARVSVPLAEYEALKKAQERASITVVDTLRLLGSFKARDLEVTFSGRSAGSLPAIEVLQNAAGIVVFGCDGDGIVSRGDGGAFRLTPLAPRFTVRCRLAVRGSDRLEMWSTPSVLWVESGVADGELVLGADEADGRRQFSVVRRVAVAAEGRALKPSATGRYRITLRPDETRFYYQIEVHNPNRARQFFEVALLSGEQVQQVDAPVSYDLPDGHYRFDLPPGDTTLKLAGSLAGSSFKPPIEGSLQYCLLESHPLLRPDVVRAPKRVSPQEVGLPAEYRGAQAFVVGTGDTVVWTATALEALRTTSFAVSHVSHTFFVPVDGPVLGQSDIAIDNQGGSDVSLPMSATPTFASLQGDPLLLTKDANGNLWLPIAQGQQALLVQHRQPYRRLPGLAWASLALPRLPVPATNGEVWLRYPADWFPVYESFLSEARLWTPDAGTIVAWVLLLLWTERVLAALGLPRRSRLVLAALLAVASLAWGWALLLLVLGDLAVSALVVWPWIRARGFGGAVVAVIAIVLGVAFLAAVSIPSLLRARVGSAPYSGEYDRAVPSSAPAPQKVEPARGDTDVAYQGLPAKFDLPHGAHQTRFTRELLDTDTPRVARVVALSSTLLGWLQALVVLGALGLLWRCRTPILDGWRERVRRAQGPRAATTPPSETSEST
jgi:hypothetical protein